ncbi:hypothetical protein SEA_SURVIVORS_67 [Gordonia phage Survivors]|uniref:Uncharacterized protein n=1 Tax=Gordonia phage Azira TaxID=3035369 RepID=A0AAF0K7L8_9CAUD|nr:hypothetical protein QLQ73_gp65 [Gordonia phage Azira]UVK59639.1 hypothetical protein SEA_SURVIVORS_67 [Gordonia phage Survivors]WGH21071.1 hypothetical protein SEA_AZIRA_65 [Gordonia phage Azira]
MDDILNKADELGVVPAPVMDTAPSFSVEFAGLVGDTPSFRLTLMDVKEYLVATPGVIGDLVLSGALVWAEDGTGRLSVSNGVWDMVLLGWVSSGQLVGDCLAFSVALSDTPPGDGVYVAGGAQ